MDLLQGTLYLLDPQKGPSILDQAAKLSEDVAVLRKQGALEDATLRRLREEWKFRQVHESAAIEGNELTLSETQTAIQRGITISGKPPEHSEEVRNLHDAIEYLEELARNSTPLSDREIREVHAIILGRGHVDGGVFRQVEVEITNSPHKPPIATKIPDMMSDLAGWLQAGVDHVPIPLAAAVLHAWLAHIHPFRDGNGRTARAIGNLLLMRAGFPVVIVRYKDRPRYYEALRCSDDGDIGPLLELIVERCRDSMIHIDRVRKATTGVSIAMERAREVENRKYRVWLDGVRLLASTMDDYAKEIGEASGLRVLTQRYGEPTEEDYQALCRRDTAGAGWLDKIVFQRGVKSHAVLLWAGFSSDSVLASIKTDGAVPTVWISMENPVGSPTWIEAGSGFPSTCREFAYSNGSYWSRNADDRVSQHESVNVLAAEFIGDLISGWFG